MSAAEPVIEISGLDVALGGQLVLENIDMRVERGDFMALLGPSGGGKTTLLRVLLGLLTPDRGRVSILGQPPEKARGRIGYVAQHASFDRDFPITGLDIVRMGRLGKPDDDERCRAALQRLGISEMAARQVGTLSGGQLQRVLIARALAMEPDVLLLDEPTAALDIQNAAAFYDLLGELSAEVTLILSTHDVMGVSTRVGSIACLNRTLTMHGPGELPAQSLAELYGCPVELVAHGAPHRVLGEHR